MAFRNKKKKLSERNSENRFLSITLTNVVVSVSYFVGLWRSIRRILSTLKNRYIGYQADTTIEKPLKNKNFQKALRKARFKFRSNRKMELNFRSYSGRTWNLESHSSRIQVTFRLDSFRFRSDSSQDLNCESNVQVKIRFTSTLYPELSENFHF